MSRNKLFDNLMEREFEIHNPEDNPQWTHFLCRPTETEGRNRLLRFWGRGSVELSGVRPISYTPDWAKEVSELLTKVVTIIVEKRKQEFRFNLLQAELSHCRKRIQRLESLQTKIIPIDSFAPEPYDLLKTILVTVHSVEGEFEAGWFDANIHFSGDNEEEAVRNLKSLILDSFESFSGKRPDILGPEPTRQLAVMKEYIQKRP